MGWWLGRSADGPHDRERRFLLQEVARLEAMAPTAQTLTALGRLHEWLGDRAAAAATYRRALEDARREGSPPWLELQLEARASACLEPEVAGRPLLEVTHRGRSALVGARACVLGRGSRAADVCIPASTVAHQHCALWLADGAWHALDLGSTNGTRIDGVALVGVASFDGPVELELADQRVGVRPLRPRSTPTSAGSTRSR